jgi:outer membrane protein assembly factor BamB
MLACVVAIATIRADVAVAPDDTSVAKSGRPAVGSETTRSPETRWPTWRGPRGDGVSPDGAPVRLEGSELWSWKDPGQGHSSPIVWEDALFLTTLVDESRLLVRIDAHTGAEVWRREVIRAPLERRHAKNSHASATPLTDGERIYTAFLGENHRVWVAAHDFEGRSIWKASPGEHHSMHGFSSTPVRHGELIILNCDQDADACIVALDRRDGKEKWRIDRENKVRSYCTPAIVRIGGIDQMILAGSRRVTSYDPRDGSLIWRCEGPTEQCVASIVYGEGLVFVTGGFPDRYFFAIDPSGKGDVTETHIRWRQHRRGVAYVPSPVFHAGSFFVVCDETGVVSELAAKSGDYVRQKRLAGNYSASLLLAGRLLYAASESGLVTILDPSRELETVGEWQAESPIYATPAVAHGRIFVRSWKELRAFGSQARKTENDGAQPVITR